LLCNSATKIFTAFNGVGYARLDFRMNDAGKLFFLEINFTCSVFYKDGYEGSADYILKYDSVGQSGFLNILLKKALPVINANKRPIKYKAMLLMDMGFMQQKIFNQIK